jgi:choline dehydrogenase
VVVAAGTYASPALLLRSGIGPASQLRALDIEVMVDLPGVGAHLADHPAISVDLACPASPTPVPVHQIAATLHSESQGLAAPPDLQFLPCGPFHANGGTLAFVVALLKPRSRGTVRLRSADPADPPDILLGYFDELIDLDRLAQGVKQARDIARCSALMALTGGVELAPGSAIAEDEALLRAWVRAQAWTYHHPVGTCAMGLNPDIGAVVDPDCRVFGVDGLIVADASVMPDIPSANTHIPTVMIAEKVAASLR